MSEVIRQFVVHFFFGYYFPSKIKNFKRLKHIGRIPGAFGGHFGCFFSIFVKPLQNKGVSEKNQKFIFFPVLVWGWLRWLALVLTLYFRRFRAHLIRCLLLKSAFLAFVLIFGGARKKIRAIEWILDFALKSFSLLIKTNIEAKKTVGFHSDSLSNFHFHFWGFFPSNLGQILAP